MKRSHQENLDKDHVLADLNTYCDGLKDSYRVFQRAIDMGVRRISLEAGTYYLSKPLVVYTSDVVVVGKSPEETIIVGKGHKLFDVRTRPLISWEHGEDIPVNTSELPCPNDSRLSEGLMVHISASHGMPEETSGGYTSHHTAFINGRLGDQWLLDRSIEIPFHDSVQVAVYQPSAFTLRNLTLETDNTPYIVEVENRRGVLFENIVFRTTGREYMGTFSLAGPQLGVTAIGAYGCMDVVVDSCRFENIWYGVMAHKGCYNVLLQNSTAIDSRHISNNAIGTDKFRVVNCIALRCEGGFDSHPTALGTTFVNCQDLQARAMSKFRGRRDSVINCVFEHGLELSTDPGVLSLSGDGATLYKLLQGSRVSGDIVSVFASNVTIKNCIVESPIIPTLMSGKFTMNDVIIDLRQAVTTQATAITFTNSPASGYDYTIDITNLEVIGPGIQEESPLTLGVYIPMRQGVSGSLNRVHISGFEKGLVLYGGEESRERYRGMSITNMVIRSCKYGIYQQDFFDKPFKAASIQIVDCEIDDNAPGRIPGLSHKVND